MQVPRLEKIVLNMGLGEAIQNAEAPRLGRRGAARDHRPEAGRHARPRRRSRTSSCARACRSACMVTLRGERMYEFLDRLVNVALPRVRDFRGVPDRAFDGRGNYSLGLREQIIFPEIDFDKVDKVKGLTDLDLHDGADRRRGQGAAARARHAVPRREEDTMAKTCLMSEGDAAAEVRGARSTTAARSAGGRARSSATSACAASACATSRARDRSPASSRRAGEADVDDRSRSPTC